MRLVLGVAALVCIFGVAAAEPARDAGSEEESARVPEALGLKLYVDELDPTTLTRIVYGYDREAVCASGTCDDSSPCATNLACAGIGSGLCNYTACTDDFSPNCAPPNDTCGVLVESLTPGAPVGQTVWELVCDPATPGGSDCQVGVALPGTTVSWDFSDINLTNIPDLIDTASTTSPMDSTETPNYAECGFNEPGALLGREDKDWPDPPNTIHTHNSLERENGVQVCMNGGAATNGMICTSSADCDGGGTCETTATIWLRAAVRYEGVTGELGEGESRTCHIGDGRTELPLWRFPNQDAGGQYMQFGDSRWEHTPFACENTITFPTAVNVQACSGFEGKQFAEVVNEGVVELPSGHKFESLVVRSSQEFCVYILGCLINVDSVRTVLYLWEVPHVGTVVRLQSDKVATNLTDFTHLAEMDVKHGLFPPLSVTTGAITSSSVELSWNPGLITDHIDGYRIYWDTESGGRCNVGGEDCNADHPGAGNCPAGFSCCSLAGDTCDGYDFDSDTFSGQVTWDTATSATISGLDPSTTYYFTVTSKSSFINPTSLVVTNYESFLYPTQIPAVPVDLPIEVGATTSGGGCTPTDEINGLMLDPSGSDTQFCWSVSSDPCIDGYRILGAPSPESPANFTTERDTGLVTCESFDPAGSYFLVVGRNAAGQTGPWGHHGQ
jgi:hypothetical protein